MHKRSKEKGKGALPASKERLLHIVSEPVGDVYDFDQQDTSRSHSAKFHSSGVIAEFRSPKHAMSGSKVTKNWIKNQMLPSLSATAAIEENHSGKTSTPCAVPGYHKTKKVTLGTPAPWVELSRLPHNILATYAVSPIAVEHNSPNDLSRQIDVNSMFDDTSSVVDDSAVYLSKNKSDKTGCDRNNKMSPVCASSVLYGAEDGKAEGVGLDYCSEKYKTEVDSGYPRFDSQCDFISLSAGDYSAVNHAPVYNLHVLKTASENNSADSDCEVVSYKRAMVDSERKVNSVASRSLSKIRTRRHKIYEDVEPSDTSDCNSDAGGSSQVKSSSSDKSSARGKMNKAEVEEATAVPCKANRALKTRNNAVDYVSANDLSVKGQTKENRMTKLIEVPSGKCLPVKKENSSVDVKGVISDTSKFHSRPAEKQTAACNSKKRKEEPKTKGGVCASGAADVENTNTEYITVETFLSSLKSGKQQKVHTNRKQAATSKLPSREYMDRLRELDDIAENYSLIIE